jgi:hypothetical protein
MNPCLARPVRAASALALLSILLLAAGCATFREEREQDALEAATTAYGAALRWGYYETAVGYLHPEKRKVAEVPKALTKIRVTRYDVVQPLIPMGDNERVQVVHIEYIHDDVQHVRSLTDRQTWRYQPDNKTWWLYSGLPAFK